MKNHKLKELLNFIDIKADWIGIREVKELTTYRAVRDGNPKANDRELTHGLLIEVLSNGQFGYYGTNKFDPNSIQYAAQNALKQANIASDWSVYKFSEDVRPKAVGDYISYREEKNEISPKVLNNILLKSNKKIKVSDKIVSATSFFKIVETNINFISTNGSDISQDFLLMSMEVVYQGKLVQ